MQNKLIFLSTLLLLSIAIIGCPMNVRANNTAPLGKIENFDRIKEFGACDSENLQVIAESPIDMGGQLSKILVNSSKLEGQSQSVNQRNSVNQASTDLGFRWCFSFTSIEIDENRRGKLRATGSLNVTEFIEIWEMSDNEPTQLLYSEAYLIPCEEHGFQMDLKSGDWVEPIIEWQNLNSSITFTGKGYIECETLDLQQTVLDITEEEYDICLQQTSCELHVNLVNYVDFVPLSAQYPSWQGPLFVYEDVVLSSQGALNASSFNINTEESKQQPQTETPYEITLQVNPRYSVSAQIESASVDSAFFIDIEQSEDDLSFKINDTSLAVQLLQSPEPVNNPGQSISDSADPYYGTFGPHSTTIYFGYNPNTGEYGTGSIINGIFDPMCCGGGTHQ